ncbi:hypothetical protein [Niveispirillum sp. KHB5.9]|uniref:hypothetical protein n=1 Tax=Niveispirillum sp. KHB5.9 TaxID=3400269 RepID=UPI003A83BF72
MFVDNGALPVSGEVTIMSLPAGDGVFTIQPFPLPTDDGVFTILPFDGEVSIQPISAEDGVVTILPFPMPGDDGVFTILPYFPEGEVSILPVFDEGIFAVRPLSFNFDFSALAIGSIDLSAVNWTNLLPADLVATSGFGFQSFVLTEEGVSLTLLDGTVFNLTVGETPAVDIVGTGRLAIDPSGLSGALLDGFNAGWI